MDQLVNDFNTALDETAGSNGSTRSGISRRKAWKRRCKSTSNLLLAGQNVSDDSSSSVDNVGLLSRERGTSSLQFSDSDLEMGPAQVQVQVQGGRQGRSRAPRIHDYRTKRTAAGAELPGVESDSFTENISPFKEFRQNSKRKRKFKRMAVDETPEVRKARVVRPGGTSAGGRKKKVRSRSGVVEQRRGQVTPGKRKRSAREKSVESGEVLSSGRSRTVSLGEEASTGQERMDMEEVGSSSSLSSSSEWEDNHSEREEGEADDEHSDWPGPEPGLSVMQLTDEEIDPEISFSQLLAGPSSSRKGGGRPVRAGTRRLRQGASQGPPPVVLAYSEQVSRFIEDSGRTALRLPAVRASDRNMILSLASLYSLSWSPEGPSVLLLTKTGQTVSHEFAVPGIPPASGPRSSQQVRERKPQDIKRQRRTPPLTLLGTPGPSKPERQPSGSKSRRRAASGGMGGSKSS